MNQDKNSGYPLFEEEGIREIIGQITDAYESAGVVQELEDKE
ncbi:hypothetical protein [Peribacillus sp. SCS-37]